MRETRERGERDAKEMRKRDVRERCESERARQGTPVFLFVCLWCLQAVGRERERQVKN